MTSVILVTMAFVGAPLWQLDPAGADAYLAALQQDSPDYLARFRRVVLDSLDTPYHDGPLGEGPDGAFDSDPLIDLTRADCVTFVEQCAALAAAEGYEDATRKLQRIRYENGTIDFAARNHFMVADWIPNNPWCIDKTVELGVPVRALTRTISKADFFRLVKAPSVGQDIADREVRIELIPIEAAAEAAARITTPSLVVFVGKIDWLFALHCGIYLPDADGGALYHASSKAGKVAAMDLGAYAQEQSGRYLGFTVYEITPPDLESAAK